MTAKPTKYREYLEVALVPSGKVSLFERVTMQILRFNSADGTACNLTNNKSFRNFHALCDLYGFTAIRKDSIDEAWILFHHLNNIIRPSFLHCYYRMVKDRMIRCRVRAAASTEVDELAVLVVKEI